MASERMKLEKANGRMEGEIKELRLRVCQLEGRVSALQTAKTGLESELEEEQIQISHLQESLKILRQ